MATFRVGLGVAALIEELRERSLSTEILLRWRSIVGVVVIKWETDSDIVVGKRGLFEQPSVLIVWYHVGNYLGNTSSENCVC